MNNNENEMKIIMKKMNKIMKIMKNNNENEIMK